MLTKPQFDILSSLEDIKLDCLREETDKTARTPPFSEAKDFDEMLELGYIKDGKLTVDGLEALEPHRVKRGVFLAAGFGSRLVPITLNTPKPLIRIRGERIIDSLIDALIEVGITDITIVRGYLSEQFDQLLYKYPAIKFLENPAYNEANNISSAICASHLFKNAYVLEADLLLFNKKLISKYQYSSNYLGVPTEKTDDWCFLSENEKIVKLKIGGENCHHMFGISYWNENDGDRLKEHIENVYRSPGGKERYWDQVALEYYINEYNVAIRECSFEDITEIDTFRELKEIDRTYDL